jgi:hypothetical protein
VVVVVVVVVFDNLMKRFTTF